MSKHCFTCGGEGFKDKVCPECGYDRKSFNFEIKLVDETVGFLKKVERSRVPREYQGVVWNKDILIKNHSDLIKDGLFLRYIDQLDKISTIFASGKLPNKSIILIAPAKMSKEIFSFYCMQLAIEHGFTVPRLLDSIEVKRLLVLASENTKYKLYDTDNGGIFYDDYITSDILFMTVTKTQYKTEAYAVIMELISRRSRLGLPTVVTSRYPLRDLAWADKRDEFYSIIDRNGTENSLKYPAIIEYGKGFKANENF